MKKTLVFLITLGLIVLLCACGNTPAPAASPEPALTPAPTPVPEPTSTPEPSWEPGVVRADYGLLAKSFNRGDSITVIGQLGDYYIVSDGSDELLVESRFVLLNTEAFESYEAYFRNTTDIYPTAYLHGEPIADLSINTKLQVVSGKDGWLYVEWDGGSGYISEEGVSTGPIEFYYGNGGGDSSGQTVGVDGGDISLLASHPKGKLEKLSVSADTKYIPMDKTEAVIGSDDIEAYYIVFTRGDEVKVANVGDNECQLLLGDTVKAIPRWLLQLGSDAPYADWNGFSDNKAKLFKDRNMTIVLDELDRNTPIKVLDVLSDCYIVESGGKTAYIPLDQVGETQFTIPYYDYSSSGSSYVEEWTPPVL